MATQTAAGGQVEAGQKHGGEQQASTFNMPIEGKTIKALTTLHLKRTYDMFAADFGQHPPLQEDG